MKNRIIIVLACLVCIPGLFSSCKVENKPSAAEEYKTFIIPIQGNIAVDFEHGVPIFLRSYKGNLYTYKHESQDSLINLFNAESSFDVVNVFLLNDTPYYMSPGGFKNLVTGAKYRLLDFSFGIHKGVGGSSINFDNKLYTKVGYPKESTKSPNDLILYGNKSLVAVHTFNKTDQTIRTHFLDIPIIPSRFNDGSYYGSLLSFMCQNDSILLISYEHYPIVYLFNMKQCSIIDSIEFERLQMYGHKAADFHDRNPNKKRIFNRNQPRYGPALFHGSKIIRAIILKDESFIVAFETENRSFSKYHPPKQFHYASLLSTNGTLYQTTGYDSSGFKVFSVYPAHLNNLMSTTGR